MVTELGAEDDESMESDATCITDNLTLMSNLEHNDVSLVGEVTFASSDELAARIDDVEASPKEWNQWILRSYTYVSFTGSPLICYSTTISEDHTCLFDALRKLALRLYRRNVYLSLIHYLKINHFQNALGNVRYWFEVNSKLWSEALKRDIVSGVEVLSRTSNTTWWDWSNGSSLIFWRWPVPFCAYARDDYPLYVTRSLLPRYMKQQKWPENKNQRRKLLSKLVKVRSRGYIQQGFVRSLTGYFAVPKADMDIRVVYDATKCGLNAAL